ncbi:unnamed protein product [Malassezia sympodialis ATCC 42132]|uniref:uncharacterized protein n=1 Tax=Malassezia sympodialis (strain ATCC 42132) TaxID=1230383 RepID=UPI0002C1FFC2|nr:uncharacterized protein MSY001_0104 [Malassezia sympodialis ATCC 42132]CCU97398.1 unnamed protein product [Malassezia sympodialis ATCC 42132]|eukprot:XP_018738750.1 uncharacterized protein MSY001_0104 [Malassezia sympodialis ATCC 42132]
MDESESAVRVMKATRTLSLDAPEAALVDVHGYAGEPAVYSLSTEYAQGDESEAGPSSHLARASSLAAKAPHEAPGTLPRKIPSASLDLSDATSSDGEGDDRVHLCEIPENLPQGDLYLCGPHTAGAQDTSDGGSREAICHALGACVEAVDRVVAGAKAACPVHWSEQVQPSPVSLDDVPVTRPVPHQPAKRAFVLSRPPGHHCSGAEPSGFCWVNNAVVAAAHAYRAHKIDRILVLDIDLHHGNGTQALVWRMNADAAEADQRRQAKLSSTLRQASKGSTPATRSAAKAAEAARTPYQQLLHEESLVGPRAQRLFYGSLHDIESYPCENGDMDLIRNASVCLAGAHGQWIWNDDAEFEQLYRSKYSKLFEQARRFVRDTKALPERTLVLISCGFDACTYEYPGMQRHGKHVPPQFYAMFARDAVALANECSDGKIISMLEGGYSDRALISGALAHIGGLADMPWAASSWSRAQAPWSLENVAMLEKMAKRVVLSTGDKSITASVGRRRPAPSAAWLVRASKHFASYQRACGIAARPLESTSQPSTPRKAALRGLDLDLATPSHSTAGGHQLRDRSVRRTRSHASLWTDGTPSRTRARPRAPLEPTPSLPWTPRKQADPSILVPGALPVESAGPATPMQPGPSQDDTSNTLMDLLGRLQLQEPSK